MLEQKVQEEEGHKNNRVSGGSGIVPVDRDMGSHNNFYRTTPAAQRGIGNCTGIVDCSAECHFRSANLFIVRLSF